MLANLGVWGGIRAVDYLCSRNDVDKERIGIIGRSGGRTQAAYIAASDNRVKVLVTECFITNYRCLYQSVGPKDAEQTIIGDIKNGIDHSDLLMLRAPKPVLMITTTNDSFSIRGALETVAEVRKAYNTFHKQECFGETKNQE